MPCHAAKKKKKKLTKLWEKWVQKVGTSSGAGRIKECWVLLFHSSSWMENQEIISKTGKSRNSDAKMLSRKMEANTKIIRWNWCLWEGGNDMWGDLLCSKKSHKETFVFKITCMFTSVQIKTERKKIEKKVISIFNPDWYVIISV